MFVITAGQVLTCRCQGQPKRKEHMLDVGLISDGALCCKDGKILAAGEREKILEQYGKAAAEILEYPDCVILPGLVDSHTHPVFAGSRIDELTLRLQGADYLTIQAQGGGIKRTVKATRSCSDELLYNKAARTLQRMINSGTTTAEAKTGYGLSLEEEIRQLKLLNRLKNELPVDLAITFLGAHSLPPEYAENREGYVELVINEMLPQAVGLAEFADVFCEKGAFTLEETERILKAAKALGFKLKIHAEQFTNTGAASLASELGAVSADHLEALQDPDIQKLASSSTVATLLPLTPMFMGQEAFPPARKLLEQGAIVALATDYNAGSCFSEGMPGAINIAALKMRMTPEECINASTVNAAFALDRLGVLGSLDPGKQADFIILELDDYREFPYHLGTGLIKAVFKRGRKICG